MYNESMSFRTWLSALTLILLVVIIYLARHEIADAWRLLGTVNLWILAIVIPMQLVVYYAAGETIFSYLRSKGSLQQVGGVACARMALEINFVNHALPSAGVSGISYMNWRLGNYGVKAGRATMSQIVRFAMTFISFIVLLLGSVLVITIDGNINRWIILFSCLLVIAMLSAIFGAIFMLSNRRRIIKVSAWLSQMTNTFVRRLTFGRVVQLVHESVFEVFFLEMHDDYAALIKDKRSLKKPFWWALLFNAGDVSLFFLTFLALGDVVNPAIILIAYGLASMAGFIFITPGGAGLYEAIMVSLLAVAGVASGVAIAGILLARVIILLFTIGLGYVFYQDALLRYGKGKSAPL